MKQAVCRSKRGKFRRDRKAGFRSRRMLFLFRYTTSVCLSTRRQNSRKRRSKQVRTGDFPLYRNILFSKEYCRFCRIQKRKSCSGKRCRDGQAVRARHRNNSPKEPTVSKNTNACGFRSECFRSRHKYMRFPRRRRRLSFQRDPSPPRFR